VTGIPKILTIDSDEVRKSHFRAVEMIVETVRIALEQTPPELAADIVDTGIVLTAGDLFSRTWMSAERGDETADHGDAGPPCAVVLGSGKALDDMALLKRSREVTLFPVELKGIFEPFKTNQSVLIWSSSFLSRLFSSLQCGQAAIVDSCGAGGH